VKLAEALVAIHSYGRSAEKNVTTSSLSS